MGAFASIYHPVGIPMLVQNVHNPGEVIGMNGLAGNLGIAVAAILTGFLIKWAGWRAAFVVPGLLAFACGVIFALQCPRETVTPAKRSGKAKVALSSRTLARVFFVMTATAATSSILFNFTTSGNAQLLAESFRGVIEDPALLGALLALIFGSIPFTDAMIVRYVDDRLRSRVAGMRLTVAFGISSLAVWALGPLVKGIGFSALLWGMAGIAALKAAIVLLLPDEKSV